jgi:hypothetical protein
MSTGRKIVGFGLIGVGVLAGVGAGVAGLYAKGKADDVSNASKTGGTFNPEDQTAGKNASNAAIGLGIGAGACAAAGIIVLLTGGSSSSEAGSESPVATASVTPWLGAGLVGAGADFRF